MPLLAEYALTPDVFDSSHYESEAVAALYLKRLKEDLLIDGVVRDLRDGEWSQLFASQTRPWHRRAKEVIRQLKKQNRLLRRRVALTSTPTDDSAWCKEALASHEDIPLTGIICNQNLAQQHKRSVLVEDIAKLSSVQWWKQRSPSVRLERTLKDYLTHLGLLLTHANSLMFIDPHLHPGKNRYYGVKELLGVVAARAEKPRVELHRVSYDGSERRGPCPDWKSIFQAAYGRLVAQTGLEIEVYIWPRFHDRFLITNLLGISLPYGFDTSTGGNMHTTWTRLGRNDSADIQFEFDPAKDPEKLINRFKLVP